MSLPDGFYQEELFPETKPKESKPKKLLTPQEVHMVKVIRAVVQGIQTKQYGPYEVAELLRQYVGVPEWLTKRIVWPFYNVEAEHEYMMEHILESLNKDLYKKYQLKKEEFIRELLGISKNKEKNGD